MAGAQRKVLDAPTLRRIRLHCHTNIQRVTLAELARVADLTAERAPVSALAASSRDSLSIGHVKAAQWTHRELKVRIAHRLNDFLFLPYKAMAHPSVKHVYEKYVSAYWMHEEIKEPTSLSAATAYWSALARTFDENKHVTRLLGRARNQLANLDPAMTPVLDEFLNHFFESRIGTHLIGAAFLNDGPAPPGTHKPAGVALFHLQPTNIAECVRQLCSSLSSSRLQGAAPLEVDGSAEASINYIPGHINVILREVLQNAMVATKKFYDSKGIDPEPVRVKVHRGRLGVFVTISDRGGGIADMDRIWSWGQEGGEEQDEVPLNSLDDWSEGFDDEPQATMVPLGFGAPLARLVAKYFGGDMQLQTLVGYGTNAYSHSSESDASSILSLTE